MSGTRRGRSGCWERSLCATACPGPKGNGFGDVLRLLGDARRSRSADDVADRNGLASPTVTALRCIPSSRAPPKTGRPGGRCQLIRPSGVSREALPGAGPAPGHWWARSTPKRCGWLWGRWSADPAACGRNRDPPGRHRERETPAYHGSGSLRAAQPRNPGRRIQIGADPDPAERPPRRMSREETALREPPS